MRQLHRFGVVALAAVFAGLPAIGSANLTFNLTHAEDMDPQALAGFQAAANLWTQRLKDNVTVNIQIDFASLGSGILGGTNAYQSNYSYTDVRNALVSDITSADDTTATNHLQSGSSLAFQINHTANNPNGFNSSTPYLDDDGDANNSTIHMSQANAKALGLRDANDAASDAYIVFSSNFSFDFDRSDGISAGQYDFVGIAAHEIGHALGFISGVDDLDQSSATNDENLTYFSTLDLFRYSAPGSLDWTADTRDKYFSLDGGDTDLGSFSTGVRYGDGRQASHWKDNMSLGIMDPTAASGEYLVISDLDLRAMDAIGYDAVPEPATMVILGVGALGLLRRRKIRS